MDTNLGYKLLMYIGFILPTKGFNFSYEMIQKSFEDTEGKNYHLSTLRKEYSLLKKNGMIEFKSRYRKPVPALTQKGKLAVKTHLSFKQYGSWDEKWRMVIFDIPEKERKSRWALRHKLNELGFGKLQKSAWVSPFPFLNAVNRFASDLGIRQHLRFIEIAKIDDEKKLIENVWHISQINETYQNFIQNAKKQLAKKHKQPYWPLIAKKIELEFAQIYKQDPHLPEKFLPKDWAGQNAYKVFKEISNSY